jgi:hypothetical protein
VRGPLGQEMIRSFNSPVLFNCRTLCVLVVTSFSPVKWRRLCWHVRKHPEFAKRNGWELVIPGHAVPVIQEFTKEV